MIGAFAAVTVLLMLLAASMPAMADAPMSPDLIIDPLSISMNPSTLIQGVPVVVTFEVRNEGVQNSYSLLASIFVLGKEVDNSSNSELRIGNTWEPVLLWTPSVPGTYNVTLKAWYGPSSAKEDVKWSDNTVEYPVTVLSRPDAKVGSSDLRFEADNPDYVVDGDQVTLRATIHNEGDAPIESCNVTFWERTVGGELIYVASGVTIPGKGSTEVSYAWNTTGWSGKRRIIVDVTDVNPIETATSDNTAWFEIKIHTKEDRVFTTRGNHITSQFKMQFFVAIQGATGELSILESGNATVYQDFPDQYDIVVTDQGKLTIRGGLLWSDLNYTVFLRDDAKLTLTDWASSNIRVIASGNCQVNIWNSTLDAPSFEMAGGVLDIRDSTFTTDTLLLDNVDVRIRSSQVTVGATVMFDRGTTVIRDTEFRVVREYEDFGAAVSDLPQLEEYDPETNMVEDLEPAIIATGGAVVDLINVSVESQVLILSEDNLFWTPNRLGAQGRTSFVNVYRYLVVQVRDWSDQVVPGAQVWVLDYFEELVIKNGTTDEKGDVTLEVLTDYVTAAQKPYVGNLRVRASAFGRTPEDTRISHYKYPDMDFDSNLMVVQIEMPPNPHPELGAKVERFLSPHEINGGESAWDKNIVVDNTELTLTDTYITMEQDFDFEWFILVTGEFGTLKVVNSTMTSRYLFTIFLEEGATLNMTMGSMMDNVRIIASDDSTIQVIDSSIEGGIYAECRAIEFVRSFLDVEHTRLEASTVSITGGYVHEKEDLFISATDVHIVDVELSAAYEIANDVGFVTLRDLVRFFGWSLLNNIEYLTNISLGYFYYFADESNITIETSRLTVDNSLIYAVDTNILVRRSPQPNQGRMVGSWIGGIELDIVSDDLMAEDTNFNRVLDDFEGGDHIFFYSVQVPGIVCYDSAVVERHWFLTVSVFDGAGSIVYGALLEVFSTDTNEKILPAAGTESLSSSRTNTAGKMTVAIKSNETTADGDFFEGSVYFRCKYDQVPFDDEPIYTNTLQRIVKADRSERLDFIETITPPEKEIIYALYNMTYSGPSEDLRFYHHTFDDPDEAAAFLNIYHGFEPDRIRDNWTIVRNTTITMSFYASTKINDEWLPLSDGLVKIYILDGHNVRFDPSKIARFANDTLMVYNVYPDEDGWGNTTIRVPASLANFQLYIAISGGQYDPQPQPIVGREWNFTVAPPQTVQVDRSPGSTFMSPNPAVVGTLVTVQGYVRYIYTNGGVDRAEVTISGTHISTTNGLTDTEGRFAINIQAPILVMNNLTLHIRAEDPRTGENDTFSIQYDVIPPPKPDDGDDTNWALIWTVLILTVLGFAIAFGAVMMYRKHYGEVVECGECGAFIAASSTSCPKCGIEFETDLARCSECEAWIPANSSACPVCGTAFTIESLEEQVAREEADEELAPIDQVTTSTTAVAPLALEAAGDTKWGDREEKRRRRIKKRVKKRLTVTDTADMEEDEEGAKDLFIGDETDSTRLPGLDLDESALADEDLSTLLPTENMLKDLMLTSDDSPVSDGTEALEPEGDLGLGDEDDGGLELEEVSLEEALPDTDSPLEEVPAPVEVEDDLDLPEDTDDDLGLPMDAPDEDEGPLDEEETGGSELLSELGLTAPAEESDMDVDDEDEGEDDSALSGLLAEEEEAKEAPKLCPNCGGNWILYKDGEYTCRICGENW